MNRKSMALILSVALVTAGLSGFNTGKVQASGEKMVLSFAARAASGGAADTASGDAVSTPEPSVSPTASPSSNPATTPAVTPTDTPTEKPTDVPTEKPTDAPTEKPTDAPTEKPTDTPTQKPTDAPTEKPTDVPTEKPTDAPTEKPTDAPTEKPTDTPTEKPTETPTQKPMEAPTEKPTDAPTEKPTDAPTEKPTEKPTETPTQKPTDAPTEKPTAAPTQTPSEMSVKYNSDEIFVAKGKGKTLSVTADKNISVVYEWYRGDDDTKVIGDSASYKISKISKIGTVDYYCLVKADGYKTVKCTFKVTSYNSSLTIAWGSSKNIKDIFGSQRTVSGITIPSKYKKYLSKNVKSGKITAANYTKDKVTVTYVMGKKKIKISVSLKIPSVSYSARYVKKKQRLEIRLDGFAMKHLDNIYLMMKGTKWTSQSYRLKNNSKKLNKTTVVIGKLAKPVKRIELKFNLGTKKKTSKVWKCSYTSKKNLVKQVK